MFTSSNGRAVSEEVSSDSQKLRSCYKYLCKSCLLGLLFGTIFLIAREYYITFEGSKLKYVQSVNNCYKGGGGQKFLMAFYTNPPYNWTHGIEHLPLSQLILSDAHSSHCFQKRSHTQLSNTHAAVPLSS